MEILTLFYSFNAASSLLFSSILKSQDYGDISAGAPQGHLTMS